MTYRVFIGPVGRRVFHCNARTKRDAIKALFGHIDAMRRVHREIGDSAAVDQWGQHEARLIGESDRILRERHRPMPSGLHGPIYSAPFGSICK